MVRLEALLVTLLLCATMAVAPARAQATSLYTVEISHAGATALHELVSDDGVRWWIELGDVLVVSGSDAARKRAARAHAVTPIEGPRTGETLYIGHRAHGHGLDGARILAASGVFALVAATSEQATEIDAHHPGSLQPLQRNFVYARSILNEPVPVEVTSKSSAAAEIAAEVDVARWRATVDALVAFETRFTGSPGALAARDYIAAQFEALGLPVTIETVPVGSRTAYNVIAELRGTTRPDEIFIVCGHYDSISEVADRLAPGAEDNASGAGGVVELARVFAANRPEATIRFIAFSGEEQGLFGSRDYVDDLVRSGEAARVKAAINMDMIAFSGDADLDVLLETGANGRDLSDSLAAAASVATSLRVVRSYSPFGSDHVPFIQAGIPSILTIENDWDSYPDYHSSRDTMKNVRDDMGGQVLRMNAAAIAALAGGLQGGTLLTVTDPVARKGAKIVGGFVQTIAWTASDDVVRFDLAYSLDGGASFTPIATGLPGDEREHAWIVPASAQSNNGRVRVVGHLEDGTTVEATSNGKLKLRPGAGPFIKTVKLKASTNADFFVKGKFSAERSRIEIDGVGIAATITDSRDVTGNVAKRLYGKVPNLDAVMPRGVPVRVRVVEIRTGLATAELVVTR